MKAIGLSGLARRGAVLFSVALLAMVGLAGAPAADDKGFPAWIPLSNVPSGVAVDKPGNVFVSVREGTQGVIWKYTKEGTASHFADIGVAVVYGLAVSPNGDLYVAMATGPDQGVYRVDRKGTLDLLPGTGQIVFPNGLAFDDRGNLYVTESYSGSAGAYGSGGVWIVPPRGEAKVWVQDPKLTGIGIVGYPVGANGIAYYHGDLFVTNTDKGLVVRIPVLKDGSAGPIEAWKTLVEVPESLMAGFPTPVMPDGLALDVHGNLYMTVISRNAIIRVMAADRSQHTVAVLGTLGPGPSFPLDSPASLAFGTGAGEQQNLFVTNLGMTAAFTKGKITGPGKGLTKVPAGSPGRPL